MLVIQQTIGLEFDFEDLGSQTRFVTLGLIIVAIGVAVAWLTGRSVFAFEAGDPRIQPYLSAATAISAFALCCSRCSACCSHRTATSPASTA